MSNHFAVRNNGPAPDPGSVHVVNAPKAQVGDTVSIVSRDSSGALAGVSHGTVVEKGLPEYSSTPVYKSGPSGSGTVLRDLGQNYARVKVDED